MPDSFVHLFNLEINMKDIYSKRQIHLCDIDLLPVLPHLRLKATSLGESNAGSLRAGSNMFCQIRPMVLELWNIIRATQTSIRYADFKRLKEMLAGWVSLAFVDHRMVGEVCETVVGIIFVIE